MDDLTELNTFLSQYLNHYISEKDQILAGSENIRIKNIELIEVAPFEAPSFKDLYSSKEINFSIRNGTIQLLKYDNPGKNFSRKRASLTVQSISVIYKENQFRVTKIEGLHLGSLQ